MAASLVCLANHLTSFFLQNLEFQNPGQKRDALRLLCLLLPRPNRDTLQEVLQFFSRVALHANDMMELRYRYERGAKQKTKLTERVWYYFLFSLQVPGKSISLLSQDFETLNFVERKRLNG